MRHGKKFNHLGRKSAHRRSMLANMASSLIEHKRINTTVAKAKALRQFVEPIITKSKEDTTHNRRLVFAELRQKEAVTELFREVAPKVGERPGGYTRIIKLGNRLGDNADMAMIELVDFNELYNTDKPEKKTRRSRRGKGTSEKATASEGDTSAKATAPEGKTSEKPKTEPKSEEVANTAEGSKAEEEKKEEASAKATVSKEAKATDGKAETKPAPEAKQDAPKKNKDQI